MAKLEDKDVILKAACVKTGDALLAKWGFAPVLRNESHVTVVTGFLAAKLGYPQTDLPTNRQLWEDGLPIIFFRYAPHHPTRTTPLLNPMVALFHGHAYLSTGDHEFGGRIVRRIALSSETLLTAANVHGWMGSAASKQWHFETAAFVIDLRKAAIARELALMIMWAKRDHAAAKVNGSDVIARAA